MPCNCGKSSAKQTTYVYVDPKGRQTSYRTEIEAKAAKIRAGGGGSIRTESS